MRGGSRRTGPWLLRAGDQSISTLVLAALLLLSACVSIQVEPLTHEPSPARGDAPPVAPLDAAPARPHVKLARIIATSEYVTEETLREKILERARLLGADAVVLGQADVIEAMGGGSGYQDTMAAVHPEGAPLFGGWGSPFYLDPWTYAQGASDRVERVLYLSGVAIRYTDSTTPEHSPPPTTWIVRLVAQARPIPPGPPTAVSRQSVPILHRPASAPWPTR